MLVSVSGLDELDIGDFGTELQTKRRIYLN